MFCFMENNHINIIKERWVVIDEENRRDREIFGDE